MPGKNPEPNADQSDEDENKELNGKTLVLQESRLESVARTEQARNSSRRSVARANLRGFRRYPDPGRLEDDLDYASAPPTRARTRPSSCAH